MLTLSTWLRVFIVLLCLTGIYFAFPNFFYTTVEKHNDALTLVERGEASATELQSDIKAWPSWLPSSLVNLGLDLRGGAHLLAEVQVEDVYADRMDAWWPEIRDTLRQNRELVGGIRRQDSPPSQLWIAIENTANIDQGIALIDQLATPVINLAGIRGKDLNVSRQENLIIVELTDEEKEATNLRTMEQSLEIIRRRVDEVGTREPIIQRQGTNRIIIQVPGIGSAEELKTIIGTTAKLTFHHVQRTASDRSSFRAGQNLVYPDMDNPNLFYVLERVPEVSGDDLTDAQPAFDENGRPAVSFRFNPTGARKFGDYTAVNIGNPFAIVLDEEVISAPVIQSHIPGGSGIITGTFTLAESTQLAVLLRAGALPAKMTFLEERTVGPDLGQDSIDAGKIACIIALAAVIAFMILSYGLFGLFANIALLINLGLIFGVLSVLGATLTLPGIAGIVLTIGMAVDANVLIFERIREELLAGRGPSRSIEQGYEKALSAILDANLTTLIAAVILFALGSGPVRGFSITLGIGIVTSVFTAIFITRLLIILWLERVRPKKLVI